MDLFKNLTTIVKSLIHRIKQLEKEVKELKEEMRNCRYYKTEPEKEAPLFRTQEGK